MLVGVKLLLLAATDALVVLSLKPGEALLFNCIHLAAERSKFSHCFRGIRDLMRSADGSTSKAKDSSRRFF